MPSTLKELREQNGWSQAALARRAEIHPSTISLIESGRLAPYAKQIEKIARALGVSPRKVSTALARRET